MFSLMVGFSWGVILDVRGKCWQCCVECFYFIGKGVNVVIFCCMELVYLILMIVFCQCIQYCQYWCLFDVVREQSDWCLWFNVKEEIFCWGGQIDYIVFVGMVMQLVGNLIVFFVFNCNVVVFVVCFVGQGVLVDFLIFEVFWFQLDGQVLVRLVIGDWLVINWFEFKVGDKLVVWGFFYDVECVGFFLVVGFIGVLLIDFGFMVDKDVCQYVVGFISGIEYFLVWIEYFIEGCQQMVVNNIVLFWFDLEVGVFLGDFFYCWQQGRQVIDIVGVGGNSVE